MKNLRLGFVSEKQHQNKLGKPDNLLLIWALNPTTEHKKEQKNYVSLKCMFTLIMLYMTFSKQTMCLFVILIVPYLIMKYTLEGKIIRLPCFLQFFGGVRFFNTGRNYRYFCLEKYNTTGHHCWPLHGTNPGNTKKLKRYTV